MRKNTIENITVNTPAGEIKLQTVDSVVLVDTIYKHLSSFESNIDILQLQNEILNKKISDIEVFEVLDFDRDFRLWELIVLITIKETLSRIYKINYQISWQKPNQKELIEKLTGKGSWDGIMLDLGKDGKADIMPVESKSLMINPNNSQAISLNELFKIRVEENSRHFQNEGSACAILVMPYILSPTKQLIFNFDEAIKEFNKNSSKETFKTICLLELRLQEDGAQDFIIKCHIIDSKNERINVNQIQFGKLKARAI